MQKVSFVLIKTIKINVLLKSIHQDPFIGHQEKM